VAVPQSDGKILIGAQNTDGATSAVIRLNADGVVDSTLGSDIKNITGSLNSMAAYPDGRIVTTISVYNTTTGVYNDIISRYTAAGILDTTFPIPIPIPAGWTSFSLWAVAVGQDDSIYAGGFANIPDNGTLIAPYAFLQIPTNGQGSMPGCSGSWNNFNQGGQYITHLSVLPTGALIFAGYDVQSSGVGVGLCNQPSSRCDLDANYGIGGRWFSTDWTYLYDAFFETDGGVDLLARSRGTTAYSIVRIDSTGHSTDSVDLPFVEDHGGGITRASDGRSCCSPGQQ